MCFQNGRDAKAREAIDCHNSIGNKKYVLWIKALLRFRLEVVELVNTWNLTLNDPAMLQQMSWLTNTLFDTSKSQQALQYTLFI